MGCLPSRRVAGLGTAQFWLSPPLFPLYAVVHACKDLVNLPARMCRWLLLHRDYR